MADETYFNSLPEERADAIASAAARGNEAPALVEAGAIVAWTRNGADKADRTEPNWSEDHWGAAQKTKLGWINPLKNLKI